MPVLLLTLAHFACGGDPILERAEQLDATRKRAPVGVAEGSGEEPIPGTQDGEVVPGIPDEPDPVPGIPDEPDPVQAEDPDPVVPEDPQPALPGTPGGGDTGKGTVVPGIPEEPAPAQEGTPGGAAHDGMTEFEGPKVTLRGTIAMDVSIQAKVTIDVFDGDHRNRVGPRPSLVQAVTLPGAGPFEIQVPISAGRVWLSAYADIRMDNRPTKGEPAGWFSGNPIFLESPPKQIRIELIQDKKAVGLGLDFER